MVINDQDIFTKIIGLAHNPLTPVEPQLKLYRKKFPRIEVFLSHWKSFEYAASVLDGVRALQKIRLGKPDSYVEVARSFLSTILNRHGLAEIKLDIEIKELSEYASNFAQVRYQFDEVNSNLHVVIEYQPNQNRKEDFMPLMLLHELRHVYQGLILKVPYQKQDDSPHEIDARAYQELGYQVSKWMQSNFKLFDVIFDFAYDYVPYKHKDLLQKDVDALCSDNFTNLFSLVQHQTSSSEVIWARIFHILYLRLWMKKFIAQCMLLVQQDPLPMEEIVQARSYLIESFSPDKPLSNCQDKQLQSAWHESLSYIHNRLGVIIESGQQSNFVGAIEMYCMAASDALNAIKKFPYSRYAKYLAQNIAEVSRLLNSNKLLSISDEIYANWYGFWHFKMFQDWLVKNSRKFSLDSSIALNNISEFHSKELSKVPPYSTNRKYGVDLVKEHGIACELMRDMVTASVIQYQLNPSSKVSISHFWMIRYLVLHEKELADESSKSPSIFHSNLHRLAFESLIPTIKVDELVTLVHDLDEKVKEFSGGNYRSELKSKAELLPKDQNLISLNTRKKVGVKRHEVKRVPRNIFATGLVTVAFLVLLAPKVLKYDLFELSQPSLPSENLTEPDNTQILESSFPKTKCGDSLPNETEAYPIIVYRVYVDLTEDNLNSVNTSFCEDAFIKFREDTAERVIQVASFTSPERANSFKELMVSKFGSAEVGEAVISSKQ